MSKPVARIVFSVLISLAILVALYTTVQGAASRVGVSSGRAQVTAGLLPDLGHYRIQASVADGYYIGLTEQKPANKGHNCESDSSSLDD